MRRRTLCSLFVLSFCFGIMPSAFGAAVNSPNSSTCGDTPGMTVDERIVDCQEEKFATESILLHERIDLANGTNVTIQRVRSADREVISIHGSQVTIPTDRSEVQKMVILEGKKRLEVKVESDPSSRSHSIDLTIDGNKITYQADPWHRWALVTRAMTESYEWVEFWKDMSEGGRVWSHVVRTEEGVDTFDWETARTICGSAMTLPTIDNDGRVVDGGTFPEIDFELPGPSDYRLAFKHGLIGRSIEDPTQYKKKLALEESIYDVLNMKNDAGDGFLWFWTNHEGWVNRLYNTDFRWAFYPAYKSIHQSEYSNKASVRCVGIEESD